MFRLTMLAILLSGCRSPRGTDVPSDCPVVDSFEVAGGGIVAPGVALVIEMSENTPIFVTCTLEGDEEEVHLIESDGAKTHRLELVGLAESSRYQCQVTPTGCSAGVSSDYLVGSAVMWDLPLLTATRQDNAEMSGVYTIFNDTDGHFGGTMTRVMIVDPEGRTRWHYEVGTEYVPDIDASITADGNVHMGGGWGLMEEWAPNRGIFLTITPEGEELYHRQTPAFGLGYNHHSRPMADGTYVNLTGSDNTLDGSDWRGIAIEHYDAEADTVLWSWDSQELVDAGVEGVPEDWTPWHANSVSWTDDAQGPAAYVSLYQAQQIWRIDRDDGTRTWKLGSGGDFTLLDPAGAPLASSDWFYGQHDPDWTEDMRVLVYDNGIGRPGGDFSRVAEFQLDTTAMTATLVWDWTEPNWFDPVVGDADYLPNGNILITKGFMLSWSPNSSDSTAIVELNPATEEVVWRLEWADRDHVAYRSERYDGCAIFANAKYCPAVAERIAELRVNEAD